MALFKGKEINKEDILKELEKFDKKYSETNQYKQWLSQDRFKYALEYNGKVYPPKYILSKVSGFDLTEFSGGESTNLFFKSLDFIIRSKETDTKYWKVAPGEEARFWDRCIKDSNIAVGWNRLSDLQDYIYNFDNFKSNYVEAHKDINPSTVTKNLNQLWSFVNLNIGDLIVANKGITKIVGVGKVIGGYKYINNYEEYKHAIPVYWFDTAERNIPDDAKNLSKGWFNCTIKELTRGEYDLLVSYEQENEKSNIQRLTSNLLNSKKQIILYGPPGTGKTYNTKRIATKLLYEK